MLFLLPLIRSLVFSLVLVTGQDTPQVITPAGVDGSCLVGTTSFKMEDAVADDLAKEDPRAVLLVYEPSLPFPLQDFAFVLYRFPREWCRGS